MKNHYFKLFKYCLSLCLMATLSISAGFAQVTHQVTVQNFEFVPADLEINQGDIVVWTNIDGFHNVGTSVYPGNPESFGNDPAGAGWTYSFTFNTVGDYNYQCDIHPSQMQASITVVAAVDCPALEANIGDACDDGNPDTDNDTVTADCECVGTEVFDCTALEANIGDACDDGNPDTDNDTVTADCECEGTPIDIDCINTTPFPSGIINLNTPATISISGCIWFGDVSTITGIIGGYEYEFVGQVQSSGEPVYISVRSASANGPVIGSGFSPLTVTATSDANLYVHWNNGIDCESGIGCIPATGTCISCSEFDCSELEANIGDACDDGDATTENDTVTANCECVGTPDVAVLNGSVDWNSNCDDRDAIVNFYLPGTNTLVASYNTTVNSAGEFIISDVPLGTYYIVVDVSGYLNKGELIDSIAKGPNGIAFGTIIAGDVNNNNAINILDVSLANSGYNTDAGNPNYILFADINCNGTINILDISGINLGFGLMGDTAP